MKPPLEFTARVELKDGRPVLNITGADVLPELALQRFGESQIKVILVKYGKTRTNAQNAYYWGVIINLIHAALQALGNEVMPQDVHEYLKHRFLQKRPIHNSDGEEIGRLPPSTTFLTKSEFGEYIDDIKQFAADILFVSIPDPGEDWGDIDEPVKIDGGIVVQPDTPESIAAAFLAFFDIRSATDLNDARYQILNSRLSEEEMKAAAIILREKAQTINCHFNPVSKQYIGPVKITDNGKATT